MKALIDAKKVFQDKVRKADTRKILENKIELINGKSFYIDGNLTAQSGTNEGYVKGETFTVNGSIDGAFPIDTYTSVGNADPARLNLTKNITRLDEAANTVRVSLGSTQRTSFPVGGVVNISGSGATNSGKYKIISLERVGNTNNFLIGLDRQLNAASDAAARGSLSINMTIVTVTENLARTYDLSEGWYMRREDPMTEAIAGAIHVAANELALIGQALYYNKNT